ncbi:octapeptide-repeat protein T2-like [Eriocheir sinensis]|uniref:octapeptide-repeat protein T2-like n=1 Tax=Eriocheir sinensis TaxID=95602 RepID=UPI0021C90660|nr:octapeptide-repeat protein T2-like [Eriocheir sinensis]
MERHAVTQFRRARTRETETQRGGEGCSYPVQKSEDTGDRDTERWRGMQLPSSEERGHGRQRHREVERDAVTQFRRARTRETETQRGGEGCSYPVQKSEDTGDRDTERKRGMQLPSSEEQGHGRQRHREMERHAFTQFRRARTRETETERGRQACSYPVHKSSQREN